MRCSRPIRRDRIRNGNRFKEEFPCGKCPPCRIQQRQEWTLRILLEMRDWSHAHFITLTYSDEWLPNGLRCGVDSKGRLVGGELHKRDLQLFFKRLRKLMHPESLRYFAVGEYGTKKGRPHYHAVLFSNSDLGARLDWNQEGKPVVCDSLVHEAWFSGCRVDVVPILGRDDSRQVARYCAGYVLKKLEKDQIPKTATKPEFMLASRRPGIGLGNAAEVLAEMWSKKGFRPRWISVRHPKELHYGKVAVDSLAGYPRCLMIRTEEEGITRTTGVHMVRLDGKKWPLSRTLREKMLAVMGVDMRTELSSAIWQDMRIEERVVKGVTILERFEEEKESENRAKSRVGKATLYKQNTALD